MATVSIPLNHGKFALIDEEDAALVNRTRWYVMGERSGHPYAISTTTNPRVLMHRLIMGAAPDQLVDHVNGDGLDNRRCNLRFATKSTNAANGSRHKGGSSQFKGVHLFKRDSRWTAYITKGGKRRSLGYFDSEEDAARAYDVAAVELFGEFALLNLPERLGDPPPIPRTYPASQRRPPLHKGKRRNEHGRLV